ncbi:hypothetical protein HanHA300_Chr07g0241671 [Helianthus annuus]|nr:hypothetical protein HanHA300_Chr07g0241671 [Helianthus annuus]KAJ0563063.1 hypothetical protein HanHA89_Chr07g0258851 [Helianthus annuus]KAJ0728434.1 hypothetical protein HanLR1_Chr07g0241561 [Helianthus annuus]
MERKKPFTNDRSSHYMPRIRFLTGLNMYHPYSISIRVILELLIRVQAFIKYTSQSQSRSRMKCYTIELDWTRVLEYTREFNQLSPFQFALVFLFLIYF